MCYFVKTGPDPWWQSTSGPILMAEGTVGAPTCKRQNQFGIKKSSTFLHESPFYFTVKLYAPYCRWRRTLLFNGFAIKQIQIQNWGVSSSQISHKRYTYVKCMHDEHDTLVIHNLIITTARTWYEFQFAVKSKRVRVRICEKRKVAWVIDWCKIDCACASCVIVRIHKYKKLFTHILCVCLPFFRFFRLAPSSTFPPVIYSHL
jgi:hypothetical protein